MNTTNEEVVIQAANVPQTQSQARTVAEGVWFPVLGIVEAEDAREVNPEGLDSLAADMARQGQLESALLIKQADGTHVLVFGNRRLAAAKKLGWEKLKVDIKENVSESERLQMILSENGEREDVSPFYTARLYNGIKAAEGITKGVELAQKLGKDPSVVCRYLGLAELAPEVQEKLQRCNFGIAHCVELARLQTPEDQLKLAQECVDKDLSQRALQARVKQLLNPTQAPVEPKAPGAPFQFTWKKGVLAMKVRAFEPESETWEDFLKDLDTAYRQFVEAHPQPVAASSEPAETPSATAPTAEVTQAA